MLYHNRDRRMYHYRQLLTLDSFEQLFILKTALQNILNETVDLTEYRNSPDQRLKRLCGYSSENPLQYELQAANPTWIENKGKAV